MKSSWNGHFTIDIDHLAHIMAKPEQQKAIGILSGKEGTNASRHWANPQWPIDKTSTIAQQLVKEHLETTLAQ